MKSQSNILLTGASGFIGKRFLVYLESLDVYPKILLHNSDLKYKNKVFLDLSKQRIEDNIFDQIDSVIHLAGQAHDTSGKRSSNYLSLNINGTLKLAEASLRNGVKNFIYISSTKASMGKSNISLLNKNMTYAQSKLEIENLLKDLCNDTEMLLTILRPSLVYGPEVKGNLELMQKGIKKGWFPPLPETNNKKSMIHVDDLCKAIYFLLNTNQINGKVFIATDGREYSSSEIYSTLCLALNKKIPSWKVPEKIFLLISSLGPFFLERVKKLLGNDYHSSSELKDLGFNSKFTLNDINEKMF